MAFTPTYNRKYILTGLAALYIQPFSPTVAAVLPPDSQLLGVAWPTPWLPLGATLEGVTLGFSREASDIRIEEQVTQVDQKTTSVAFTISTQLSEDTLDTMRYAYGGGSIQTIPAAAGAPGVKILKISSEIEHFAMGLEGEAPVRTNLATPWRRVLIPDVTSVAEVETAYRRAEQQRVYSATFSSLVPPEDVMIRELNAPAI